MSKHSSTETVRAEFRSLQEADLPQLHLWLNSPHVRQVYGVNPVSLDQVVNKYSPRISKESKVFCHIALLDGKPIGKFQCYKISDFPDYASEIGVADGVSLDLFIGKAELIGKGLGKVFLKNYVENVITKLFPGESACYICHDSTNIAAIACSKSCGFVRLKSVIEEGKPSELFVLRMRNSAFTAGAG
jgi:aminoglycoside 6'-N-acetyltransferase